MALGVLSAVFEVLILKKKKIPTASARENSATGIPGVIFTSLRYRYQKIISSSSKNATQFKGKKLSKHTLLLHECLPQIICNWRQEGGLEIFAFCW